MLADFITEGFLTPKRWRKTHLVTIRATVTAGPAYTIDSVNSAPRVTIARQSAGIARVTMDRGLLGKLQFVGGATEQAAESVAAADGTVYSPALLLPTSGTASVLIQRPDTGAVADPPVGSTIHLTFLLGKA